MDKETSNAIYKSINELQGFQDFEPILSMAKDKNVALRKQKTPQKVVKIRTGKGGQNWKYIDRLDAMKWLDINYPIWSWEFNGQIILEHGYYSGAGKLSVLTGTGATRTINTIGSVEVRLGKDGQPVVLPYAKMVDTDALKRAVYSLGGFADVYKDTDNEPAFEMPSDEDIDWYWLELYATLKHKGLTARKAAEKFMLFLSGDITKEYILKEVKL